jgi:xanthosine utilization system XapX-like protein
MGFDAQSTRARYALAVGASLLALGVVYAFFESHTPFLPCIATVMLISWRLGRGPGILAAAIFIAFTAFELFAASTAQNTADLSRDIARECMFAGVCALVIVISSAQHSAEKCTRDQADWLRFALSF